MGRRVRTSSRFDQLYDLAKISQQQGWPEDKQKYELMSVMERNAHSIDEAAIRTAESEFWIMVDPRLNGFLPRLREVAELKIQRQEPGGKLRFNHEMIKFCRRAPKHHRGPGAAIREIEQEVELHGKGP